MTNAQIIFNESMALMEQGIIGTTGRTFEVETENGEKITVQEPEQIHTFAAWKSIGRQVKKGEHAKAAFMIWKHTVKKKKDEEKTGNPIEDADDEKMFMKKAFFFTIDQTEPIKA